MDIRNLSCRLPEKLRRADPARTLAFQTLGYGLNQSAQGIGFSAVGFRRPLGPRHLGKATHRRLTRRQSSAARAPTQWEAGEETEAAMYSSLRVEEYSIHVDAAAVDDLKDRLKATRWPSEPPESGWKYGAQPSFVKASGRDRPPTLAHPDRSAASSQVHDEERQHICRWK